METHYDGSFQNCTSLVDYTTVSTGICWHYVWQNCSSLAELRLGAVSQFGKNDFYGADNLTDVWISDKTVDQILGVAPTGNIAGGSGAKFPWGANSSCRFHGTDGIVRADGTVIERF